MIEQSIQNFFNGKTKGLIRFETLFLIFLGIATMIFPHAMEVGFNYIFGTLCIIYGIAGLVSFANAVDGPTPATHWIAFVTALTGISVGAVMYVDGMIFVKTFLSAWLFSFGIFQIYRVIRQYKTLNLWVLTLVSGVASLFFAIVMRFDWPVVAVSNVGFFIGPNLVITGITIWYNNRKVFTGSSSKS
jgi:uncharacterized membrane protein HdeD (DUF308 family)